MVCNPGENAPVRTPTINPFTGAVRSFTRSFTYSPPDAENLDFCFALNPSLQHTLLINSTDENGYPGAQWSLLTQIIHNYEQSGYIAVGGSSLVQNPELPPLPSKHIEPVKAGPTDEQPSKVPVEWTATAVSSTFTFSTNSQRAIEVVAYLQDGAGPVTPTSWGYVYMRRQLTVIVADPLPSSVKVRGFSYREPTEMPSIGATQTGIEIVVTVNSGVWELSNTFDLFDTPALELAEGRISAYRVTAMSLLVSNASSDLTNGGIFAAARAKPGWHPGAIENAYEAITSLQDHSYRGPLRDGCFVWWLPTDIHEMDLVPFGSTIPDPTRLWVAGTCESPAAVLQLTVTINFEFGSSSQIFEHEVGPPLTDEFIRAYHMLDALPAAVCNPKHGEVLKTIVKRTGAVAKKMGRYLAENPELLLSLLA